MFSAEKSAYRTEKWCFCASFLCMHLCLFFATRALAALYPEFDDWNLIIERPHKNA